MFQYGYVWAIDSADGYHADNCRLVLCAVNIALSTWGDAVLMRVVFVLAARA